MAGRFALITGAGSGVGKASALALARAGFSVAVAGRRREPLEAVAAEVEKVGGRALALAADVVNPAAVAAMFAKVNAEFGRLDVLFNNAGVSAPGVPLEELTYAQWQAVIGANLTGAFLCTQQAFRLLKSQSPRGGRITNNGSVSATTPRPNSAPYTASKHAITGLTKATALDGRPFDIACGQIDIGNAATEMSEPIARGVPQADGRIAAEARMDPDNVANAVAFMASLPLDANVLFITVMATKMPFIGRG